METESSNLTLEPGAPVVPAGNSPLEFVEGELERTRPPLSYRLSLVVVALAMVLLPVVYFAIVGLFGWGVYYYATHCYTILTWHTYSARGSIFLFMLYLAPLLVGGILIFFLVKPIFAPRRDANDSFSLNHADAPQLFALIGWICRSLDAPIPSRIDVNCLPNASAGFRAGLRSIFGNDIVLTIGLPLVAGLDLSQFAGVIAHEYGHFSQGTGMRAMYLINRINGWFYRVVYERDAWDYWLTESSEDSNQDWRMMLVLYLARAGVWFGRGILWALMALGNLLSAFMSRQMEFDADRYEIKMSGTDMFIATFRRLRQLNLGMEMALQQIAVKWKKERKLFDQLPEFVTGRANEISAEIQGRLHASAFKRKTGLFDSHPSDAERIRRAQEANEPGIFHATAPAASLFTDFGGLSRQLTLHHYRCWFGRNFSPESLVSVEQAARQAEHDYAADRENVRRYFLGVATSLRPVIIAENKVMAFRSGEILAAEIRASRESMAHLLPAAQTALAQFKEADEKFLHAWQAAHLLAAGFPFNPADFELADNDVERAQNEAWQTLQAAGAALQPFDDAARKRLADALQIVRLPQIIGPIPNAIQIRDEAKEMIWVLSRLEEVFGPLLELRRDCAALEVLLHFRRNQQPADNLTFTLENLCAGLREKIGRIEERTSQIRYPFHHTTEQVFVSGYARNKEYHADPAELALLEGKNQTEKLIALYYRVLGNLVLIGEQVERQVVA